MTDIPSIDMQALAAQTFHNDELRAEILRMFVDQTPALIEAVRATSGAARADVAHRLKGSALAIAAGPLAEAAGRLEAETASALALAELELAVAGALDAARSILAKSAT
jgi:HPt (histidine-containing phosphotransfer) domain-containing protein